MNMLWLQLRASAAGAEYADEGRLILQILTSAAESEEMFRPLLEPIRRDEGTLSAAWVRLDTPRIAKIIGGHCRAMFKIRHDGWPTGECEELIAAMIRSSEAMDDLAMVDTFERLLRLCQSEPRTSIRQARLREIERAREQSADAIQKLSVPEERPQFRSN